MRVSRRKGCLVALALFIVGFPSILQAAEEIPIVVPTFFEEVTDGNRDKVVSIIEIVFALTILTLAPSILILTTCFTRIIVVLAFLRRGLATQQLPPDQVMMGLSLFLTFTIMGPVWQQVWDDAIAPYLAPEPPPDDTGAPRRISRAEAFERAKRPLKKFMLDQMSRNDYADLALMAELSRTPVPEEGYRTYDEVPFLTVVPAFILSELELSFQMGFLIYLPFLIIDMVIASVLMSMGMLMLPPIIISLPFKILLFVLGDGWQLLVAGMVQSFS